MKISNGEVLTFVYRRAKLISGEADNNSIHKCHKCGGIKWEARKRTGTRKLPDTQIKLKCIECGSWFIGDRERMERVLGEV